MRADCFCPSWQPLPRKLVALGDCPRRPSPSRKRAARDSEDASSGDGACGSEDERARESRRCPLFVATPERAQVVGALTCSLEALLRLAPLQQCTGPASWGRPFSFPPLCARRPNRHRAPCWSGPQLVDPPSLRGLCSAHSAGACRTPARLRARAPRRVRWSSHACPSQLWDCSDVLQWHCAQNICPGKSRQPDVIAHGLRRTEHDAALHGLEYCNDSTLRRDTASVFA